MLELKTVEGVLASLRHVAKNEETKQVAWYSGELRIGEMAKDSVAVIEFLLGELSGYAGRAAMHEIMTRQINNVGGGPECSDD